MQEGELGESLLSNNAGAASSQAFKRFTNHFEDYQAFAA